ncbi:MAG: hypothetical protein ABW110_23520 [Steroidobacteraceae bacterium]
MLPTDVKDRTPFFLSRNAGFASATAADDLLHPQANRTVEGDSLTETQYFGFNVPHAALHGYMYCWHHPNLKVVSGGVWSWRGIKRESLACELFDQRLFMSDALLANDLHSYRLDNGYSVEILEPLQRHRVRYSDPARGNSIELEYEALMPPVMFANGKHFEQAMKVKGAVTLRGKRFDVDSYNIRDRSWAKLRPEDPYAIPPVAWHTGAFNDRFIFNCTASDHPDVDPDWKSLFPDFPSDRVLNAGWIYRDGELSAVVDCRKRTVRDRSNLYPHSIHMILTDERGRQLNINGQVVAACMMSNWWNIRGVVCLTRWQCEGHTGYGDTQEPQWNDYVYHRLAGSQET